MSKIYILDKDKKCNHECNECFSDYTYCETKCVPVDIDELVQNWLDEIFPSYDHFKYHRPKPEFSEYLQERMK